MTDSAEELDELLGLVRDSRITTYAFGEAFFSPDRTSMAHCEKH